MDKVPEISGSKTSRLTVGMPLPSGRRRSSIFDTSQPLMKPPGGSSIMSFHGPSLMQFDEEHHHKTPKVQYENTYCMEPPRIFMAYEAESIIKDSLKSHLEHKKYEPLIISPLTKQIAQEIMDKLKALNYERYKMVTLVNIGEKKDHGVRCGSRCIWDTERDTWASASFMNTHLYATGEVYAMYYE